MSQSVVSIQSRQVEERDEIVLLDIGRLLPNPLNPRGDLNDDDVLELMRSIKEKGLLQPLLVTPQRAAFYIVAGHRRRRAAHLAGLVKLPCIVRKYSEEEQQELMLVENIQRQDLTAIQEARAFQQLMTTGLRASVNHLVQRVGVSESYILQRLAILKLHKAVQSMFEMQLLPVGAAPILALIEDPGRQKSIAIKAVQGQIPLKKLEVLVRDVADKPKKKPRPTGTHNRKKILGEYEVFTRSEAIHELARDGNVSYSVIADAFNDICDGVCVEEDGNTVMCEACPVPRFIASLLRRTGVDIKGRRGN
jgi:ParB family transcriptional regulator, chromosome partitioning protein